MPRLAHGTEHQALLHVPYAQKQIAGAVQALLTQYAPVQYIVQDTDTMSMIEQKLWVRGFGPSLLLGVKSLVGKTLTYDGVRVQIQWSGTSFAVQSAANDERYALVA